MRLLYVAMTRAKSKLSIHRALGQQMVADTKLYPPPMELAMQLSLSKVNFVPEKRRFPRF